MTRQALRKSSLDATDTAANAVSTPEEGQSRKRKVTVTPEVVAEAAAEAPVESKDAPQNSRPSETSSATSTGTISNEEKSMGLPQGQEEESRGRGRNDSTEPEHLRGLTGRARVEANLAHCIEHLEQVPSLKRVIQLLLDKYRECEGEVDPFDLDAWNMQGGICLQRRQQPVCPEAYHRESDPRPEQQVLPGFSNHIFVDDDQSVVSDITDSNMTHLSRLQDECARAHFPTRCEERMEHTIKGRDGKSRVGQRRKRGLCRMCQRKTPYFCPACKGDHGAAKAWYCLGRCQVQHMDEVRDACRAEFARADRASEAWPAQKEQLRTGKVDLHICRLTEDEEAQLRLEWPKSNHKPPSGFKKPTSTAPKKPWDIINTVPKDDPVYKILMGEAV